MGADEEVMEQFNYKRLAKWIIVVAIFAFLGKMLWDNWSQVKEAPFILKPFPLILSTLIYILSYFIQIWAWYLITSKLGIAISFLETSRSWFYSQFGKYLPGKVWLFLGRFYFYESKGKSRRGISIALYLETVTVMTAAGLIFVVALILSKDGLSYSGKQIGWLILLFVFAFIFLHPRVLQKILSWLLIRFKREPISLSISYSDVLWILFVCIVAWVVAGVGFYLFVDSIFPVSPHQIIFLTGALALSSILGLIAFFAPSGLGVREGTLVYLLSTITAGSVAVVISVLTRIWMTLIEIGLTGMIYLLDQIQKRLREKG